MSRKVRNILITIMVFIGIVLIGLTIYKMKSKDNEINSPKEEIPTIPEKTTYLNNITGKELEEELKKIIIEYMDTYYESMSKLEEKDMTYLFDDSNSDAALINQTALSLLINDRKMKSNDLRLTTAKYDLNIEDIIEENNTIKVIVRESNYLHFQFMEGIESKIYNIENVFTFIKKDYQYKILDYSKEQDFFVMITDKYSSGGKEELDKIKNDYISLLKKNLEQNDKDYIHYLNGTGIKIKTCDNPYNREQALNYAKNWVNKRNEEWSTFDANCQNYASQVIYNGGIPMDYKGNALSHLQWKFYNPSYNEREIASGYLYTWTYVPYFYTYAKNNTGLGLCADVDVNKYYAEAGDIIHIGTNLTETGPNRHAVVVIGTYKKDDKVVDILVNSNTVDLENYPISAYTYPYSSLIKIYGYNN